MRFTYNIIPRGPMRNLHRFPKVYFFTGQRVSALSCRHGWSNHRDGTRLQGQVRMIKTTTSSENFVSEFASTIDDPEEKQNTHRLFASCLPGLEPLLETELRDLGYHPLPCQGGHEFEVQDLVQDLCRCHLWLGSASHILWRCADTFRARGMAELRRKCKNLPVWQYLFGNMQQQQKERLPKIRVRVSTSKSKLTHTVGIAERVRGGIHDALGVDGENDDDDNSNGLSKDYPEVFLVVRIRHDVVTLSVDTSLSPLHRRGYRLNSTKAPLREDLAFSLLKASGWPPPKQTDTNSTATPRTTTLLDPFCGSGTILIEAASMAHGLPPGRLRPHPLQHTILEPQTRRVWENAVKQYNSPIPCAKLRIVGSDRDAASIAATQANAARANVLGHFTLEKCAVTDSSLLGGRKHSQRQRQQQDAHIHNCGPFFMVTNPPFGKRLPSRRRKKGKAADDPFLTLYQTLADRLNRIHSSFTNVVKVAVLTTDPDRVRRMGDVANKPMRVSFVTNHGGLTVAAMINDRHHDQDQLSHDNGDNDASKLS